MKENPLSVSSFWKKFKSCLYLNMTLILIFSLAFDIAASGSSGENSGLPQQVTIKGTVTDAATGNPISGVNVVVRGTTIGVLTDINGNYSIEVPSVKATLQFSFIGYVSQEIALSAGQNTINVKLSEDILLMEEVVVIGYGTVKKKDLTGSVSSVSAERLLDRPAFNVAEAMQGKIAGVKVYERTGAPGSAPMIRIRGTNSISSDNDPLFVVDGVIGVRDAMSTLNPNEIESMDILKDASATAIYGARGANGVIIITTKRGKAGGMQVEYDGYISTEVLQRHLYLLEPDQLMYVMEQGWATIEKYTSSPNRNMDFRGPYAMGLSYSEMPHLFQKVQKGDYIVELLGKDGNYYAPRFNTNWESEVYKPSFTNNNQLSVRGGTEKNRFSLSLGNSNNEGLMLKSTFKRYSGKITGDMQIFKWLEVSSSLNYIKSLETTFDRSFTTGGISRPVVETWTILPVKYPDDPVIYGKYAGKYSQNLDFPEGEDAKNPVHQIKETERLNNRHQVIGDVTINVKITKDLSFKTSLATDATLTKNNSYNGRNLDNRGTAEISNATYFYWQNENYFNYIKEIGNAHTINCVLGFSWSRARGESSYARNRFFFDDFYSWHNLALGTDAKPLVTSSDFMSSLNSYFARINYSFKGKYLATLTGRYDGSSKFGKNSKYGFFPSGSLAWRISEEEFMKNIAAISNLKLRLSAGQTGNQEIGNYVTQTFIGSTNVTLGGAQYSGLYPSSVGNQDLKWEQTTQYNGGIDIGLFRGRINLTLDYYNKLTKDMLLDVPLPLSTTTGTVKQNYGSVKNTGMEFTLSTHNISKPDFTWFTSIVFSSNRNEIVTLGPTGADIRRNSWVGGAGTVLRVGEPIGAFWGLKRLGTYGTEEASLAARYGMLPGDVKYEDQNNDGRISLGDDAVIIGYAFPKWEMGIENSFNYKNFDLSIDFRISQGGDKLDRWTGTSEDYQLVAGGRNSVLNAWRPDHQNTMVGEIRPGYAGAYFQFNPDSHWVQDASFIRGESATLGYSISPALLNKIGINKVRAYLNARNFYLYTRYPGYDPEISSSDLFDSLTPGMDFYSYPRPAVYTFGVNIIF